MSIDCTAIDAKISTALNCIKSSDRSSLPLFVKINGSAIANPNKLQLKKVITPTIQEEITMQIQSNNVMGKVVATLTIINRADQILAEAGVKSTDTVLIPQ